MRELALTIPGYKDVQVTPLLKTGAGTPFPTDSFAGLISGFLSLAIFVSGALMVFWLFWGVFQYIFAGGAKDKLAQARKRIVFALVGFAIVLLAYSVSQFVKAIFPQKLDSGITTVSQP